MVRIMTATSSPENIDHPRAVVLSIAGSDSGGGAGIQADLKTCAALGVPAVTVVTAVTAQNTLGVHHVESCSRDSVSRQLDAVFSDFNVAAVKVGLLPNSAVVRVVARFLGARLDIPVVVDPVSTASTASAARRMQAEGTAETLVAELIPRATLLTPNVGEVAALTGVTELASEADLVRACGRLRELGAESILCKGGHRSGPLATDLLIGENGLRRFSSPRLPVKNSHGTGCTLSSAIAAYLVRGVPMQVAVGEAKRYLSDALAAADAVQIGRGVGPLHHFHRWWET